MGKKKKMRNNLFGKDYGDISIEDQFRMSMLIDDLMNKRGSIDAIIDEEERDTAPKKSRPFTHPEVVSINVGLSYDEDEKTLQEYADEIVEDAIIGKLYSKEKEEEKEEPVVEEKTPAKMVPPSMIINRKEEEDDEYEEDDENNEEDAEDEDEVDEYDDEDDEEGEEEVSEENITLDNQFKLIQGDFETGDITIRDTWKKFKSHTISFYNMIPATMDYEGSILYQQMKGAADLALAFIAGPALIIRQGNKKFKEFIETVVNLDKERIFIISKNEEEPDAEGNEIIDFLVYYIDRDSKKELETLFDVFESPEDKDNEIALDFLYAIYSKVVDRHENPWGSYDSVDSLIREYESSDEDIDFFLDLVKKDEDTVMGTSSFDYFMDNLVMPIEAFLSDKLDGEGNIFNLFEMLLRYHFGKDSESSVARKDGVIQVPVNFGVNSSVKEETSASVVKEETVVETTVQKTVSKSVIETKADTSTSEEVEIDDVDEEDASSITLDAVEDTSSEEETTNNGIKKFGTKPYAGGSMIVYKNN